MTRAQRDLASELASQSNLEQALARCLEVTIEASQLDAGEIYLVRSDGSLELAVHNGLSAEYVSAVLRYVHGAPQSQLVIQGRPVYCRYQDAPFAADSRSLGGEY